MDVAASSENFESFKQWSTVLIVLLSVTAGALLWSLAFLAARCRMRAFLSSRCCRGCHDTTVEDAQREENRQGKSAVELYTPRAQNITTILAGGADFTAGQRLTAFLSAPLRLLSPTPLKVHYRGRQLASIRHAEEGRCTTERDDVQRSETNSVSLGSVQVYSINTENEGEGFGGGDFYNRGRAKTCRNDSEQVQPLSPIPRMKSFHCNAGVGSGSFEERCFCPSGQNTLFGVSPTSSSLTRPLVRQAVLDVVKKANVLHGTAERCVKMTNHCLEKARAAKKIQRRMSSKMMYEALLNVRSAQVSLLAAELMLTDPQAENILEPELMAVPSFTSCLRERSQMDQTETMRISSFTPFQNADRKVASDTFLMPGNPFGDPSRTDLMSGQYISHLNSTGDLQFLPVQQSPLTKYMEKYSSGSKMKNSNSSKLTAESNRSSSSQLAETTFADGIRKTLSTLMLKEPKTADQQSKSTSALPAQKANLLDKSAFPSQSFSGLKSKRKSRSFFDFSKVRRQKQAGKLSNHSSTLSQNTTTSSTIISNPGDTFNYSMELLDTYIQAALSHHHSDSRSRSSSSPSFSKPSKRSMSTSPSSQTDSTSLGNSDSSQVDKLKTKTSKFMDQSSELNMTATSEEENKTVLSATRGSHSDSHASKPGTSQTEVPEQDESCMCPEDAQKGDHPSEANQSTVASYAKRGDESTKQTRSDLSTMPGKRPASPSTVRQLPQKPCCGTTEDKASGSENRAISSVVMTDVDGHSHRNTEIAVDKPGQPQSSNVHSTSSRPEIRQSAYISSAKNVISSIPSLTDDQAGRFSISRFSDMSVLGSVARSQSEDILSETQADFDPAERSLSALHSNANTSWISQSLFHLSAGTMKQNREKKLLLQTSLCSLSSSSAHQSCTDSSHTGKNTNTNKTDLQLSWTLPLQIAKKKTASAPGLLRLKDSETQRKEHSTLFSSRTILKKNNKDRSKSVKTSVSACGFESPSATIEDRVDSEAHDHSSLRRVKQVECEHLNARGQPSTTQSNASSLSSTSRLHKKVGAFTEDHHEGSRPPISRKLQATTPESDSVRDDQADSRSAKHHLTSLVKEKPPQASSLKEKPANTPLIMDMLSQTSKDRPPKTPLIKGMLAQTTPSKVMPAKTSLTKERARRPSALERILQYEANESLRSQYSSFSQDDSSRSFQIPEREEESEQGKNALRASQDAATAYSRAEGVDCKGGRYKQTAPTYSRAEADSHGTDKHTAPTKYSRAEEVDSQGAKDRHTAPTAAALDVASERRLRYSLKNRLQNITSPKVGESERLGSIAKTEHECSSTKSRSTVITESPHHGPEENAKTFQEKAVKLCDYSSNTDAMDASSRNDTNGQVKPSFVDSLGSRSREESGPDRVRLCDYSCHTDALDMSSQGFLRGDSLTNGSRLAVRKLDWSRLEVPRYATQLGEESVTGSLVNESGAGSPVDDSRAGSHVDYSRAGSHVNDYRTGSFMEEFRTGSQSRAGSVIFSEHGPDASQSHTSVFMASESINPAPDFSHEDSVCVRICPYSDSRHASPPPPDVMVTSDETGRTFASSLAYYRSLESRKAERTIESSIPHTRIDRAVSDPERTFASSTAYHRDAKSVCLEDTDKTFASSLPYYRKDRAVSDPDRTFGSSTAYNREAKSVYMADTSDKTFASSTAYHRRDKSDGFLKETERTFASSVALYKNRGLDHSLSSHCESFGPEEKLVHRKTEVDDRKELKRFEPAVFCDQARGEHLGNTYGDSTDKVSTRDQELGVCGNFFSQYTEECETSPLPYSKFYDNPFRSDRRLSGISLSDRTPVGSVSHIHSTSTCASVGCSTYTFSTATSSASACSTSASGYGQALKDTRALSTGSTLSSGYGQAFKDTEASSTDSLTDDTKPVGQSSGKSRPLRLRPSSFSMPTIIRHFTSSDKRPKSMQTVLPKVQTSSETISSRLKEKDVSSKKVSGEGKPEKLNSPLKLLRRYIPRQVPPHANKSIKTFGSAAAKVDASKSGSSKAASDDPRVNTGALSTNGSTPAEHASASSAAPSGDVTFACDDESNSVLKCTSTMACHHGDLADRAISIMGTSSISFSSPATHSTPISSGSLRGKKTKKNHEESLLKSLFQRQRKQ